ncbi:MAG: hypothetical protein KC620_18060, partial [Myxococcales bacterium]|nr:hypothetical protein [Myxococcales bacterium]
IAYLNVVDNGGDPMTLKWYCLAGSGEHCEGSSNNRIVVPSSSYLFFEYQSDCDSLPSSPTVKSLVTSLDK